jgi:hypothetical protein
VIEIPRQTVGWFRDLAGQLSGAEDKLRIMRVAPYSAKEREASCLNLRGLWALVILLCLLVAALDGSAQELAWVRQMGGAQDDYGNRLAVDKEGNVYAVGTFTGQATFGPFDTGGIGSGYLAKMDPEGNVKWITTCGGPIGIECDQVAVDPEGAVYVAGTMSIEATFGTKVIIAPGMGLPRVSAVDFFLAKYSSDGALLWVKHYGGSDVERCGDMFVDGSGNIFVVGSYSVASEFGGVTLPQLGIGNLWLSRLDGDGKVVWITGVGVEMRGAPKGRITGDAAGNVFISSGFQNAIEFPTGEHITFTNEVWITNEIVIPEIVAITNVVCYTNFDVVPPLIDCTNECVFTNQYTISNYVFSSTIITQQNVTVRLEALPGVNTMCLAKYDANGRFIWARRGTGSPTGVVADGNGGAYLTGALPPAFGKPCSGVYDGVEVTGPNDRFLVHYDSAGNVLWARNEGGSSLVLGKDNLLYAGDSLLGQRTCAGRTYRPIGSLDLLVIRYDVGGNALTAWQMGDLQEEMSGAITLDPKGNLYVLGSSYHTSAQSSYQLTNYGSWDVFIAKLAQAGPGIVRQPTRLVLLEGSNAVFSVQVTNATLPQYQWQKNGSPLVDDDRISGTTNATLTISGVRLADEGEYSVRVTAENGTVYSAIAGLRIEGTMEFTGIGIGTAGEARVTFNGLPGRMYDVEFSTNCIHWMLLTNGFSPQGVLTISDFGAKNATQRFYRAVAH